MKYTTYIIAIVVALAVLVTTLDALRVKIIKRGRRVEATCGNQTCPTGDSCCLNNLVGPASACYNPTTHACKPDTYKPTSNSLCAIGHFAGCNGKCYDSNAYYCSSSGQIVKLDTLFNSTSSLSDTTIIKTLNSIQASWVAGANPSFAGKTLNDVKVLAATLLPSQPVVRKVHETKNIQACPACPSADKCCASTCYNPLTHVCLGGFFLCPLGHLRCGYGCYLPNAYDCCNDVLKPKGTCPGIPTSFNALNKWPGCINPIGNQGGCGSCWAFSAAQVLGDRYCINKNLGAVLSLSPQYQVSCDTANSGCSGGYLDKTWSFLSTKGDPTSTCVPYSGTNGVCPTKCANNSPLVLYKATGALQLNGNNIPSIQNEILQYGPIQAAFAVYQDFFYYTSGVYKHSSGSYVGGHAVRVVGWGVTGNQLYWIVANQWGTGFGINGFFWISRGNNEVGFESSMWRALPA